MKRIIYISCVAALISLDACKPKLDGDVELHAGELNLSRVVYVGDHLLSGYTNGGLYREGQETSIPMILNTQFAIVGGGTIAQPLMPSGSGTGHWVMDSYAANGTFTTEWNTSSAAQSGEAVVQSPYCIADSLLPLYPSYSGSITNYSIPGLRVSELTSDGLGNSSSSWFNPFFARVATGDNSYLVELEAESPTFFVCAFGLSDVLPKVEKGWGCEVVSSKTDFEDNYRKLLNNLTDKTSTGVLLEVPSIDKLPILNVNYKSTQTLYIVSKRYYNDTYEVREYEGDDQLLRATIDKVGVDGYGLSDTLPIKNEDVIDRFEKAQIAADIDKYNDVINALAEEFNLPVVAMQNYLLNDRGSVGDSLLFNGTHLFPSYDQGSAVSLDGLFPSPRGSAVIANKCIEQINTFYSARIPLADINNYPGVKIP